MTGALPYGLQHEKTCFQGLQTINVQTDQRPCYSIFGKNHLNVLQAKFQHSN